MEVKTDNFMALKSFTKSEAEFVIGERKFIMKPLVPRKLRQLVEMIEISGKEVDNLKDLNSSIGYFLTKTVDLFPIIFDQIVTQEWIDENMSIPLGYEIVEQFIKLNRLEGIMPFFQNAVRVTLKPAEKSVTN